MDFRFDHYLRFGKKQNTKEMIRPLKIFKLICDFNDRFKNLDFFQKRTDGESAKVNIIENLKLGLKEVQLFKNGKLKTTSPKDFLKKL